MQKWQRNAVIEALVDIADLDAQRASWISGAGRPIPDSIELCCQLFDDTDLRNLLSAGPVFSRECDRLLRRLQEQTERLSPPGTPTEVLESAEWRRIAASARAALECINRA